MDVLAPAVLNPIVQILMEGGPWAVIAILIVAYFFKDKECRESHRENIRVFSEQAAANTRIETVLGSVNEKLQLTLQARLTGRGQ